MKLGFAVAFAPFILGIAISAAGVRTVPFWFAAAHMLLLIGCVTWGCARLFRSA